MRVALDTNILAYAEGVNGADMKQKALDLVERLPDGAALLPVQTLGELFNLLVRKAGRTQTKARKALLSWQDAFPVIETSAEVMLAAADLATDHQLCNFAALCLLFRQTKGTLQALGTDREDCGCRFGVSFDALFRSYASERFFALPSRC